MEHPDFKNPVFGPIHSRRLGSSLGINLMPATRKVCNFNCIYCECGWNPSPEHDKKGPKPYMPTPGEVAAALEEKLRDLAEKGKAPDVITFSGNGEPTLHPEFLRIVGDTVRIRNRWSPGTKVCVLSNAGTLHMPGVVEGLLQADQRIMKVDSAFETTLRIINRPGDGYSLSQTITQLKRFEGNFTLQTLFLSGHIEGKPVDNTTDEELEAWFSLVDELRPCQVMVYTLDRQTPAPGLKKCPVEKLEVIAGALRVKGYDVVVAG
ncbi:MAG: radical SAM protein [Bacteroidales bacterium]|nr:radical SAM protein [Bacteroidales bacterium]